MIDFCHVAHRPSANAKRFELFVGPFPPRNPFKLSPFFSLPGLDAHRHISLMGTRYAAVPPLQDSSRSAEDFTKTTSFLRETPTSAIPIIFHHLADGAKVVTFCTYSKGMNTCNGYILQLVNND